MQNCQSGMNGVICSTVLLKPHVFAVHTFNLCPKKVSNYCFIVISVNSDNLANITLKQILNDGTPREMELFFRDKLEDVGFHICSSSNI